MKAKSHVVRGRQLVRPSAAAIPSAGPFVSLAALLRRYRAVLRRSTALISAATAMMIAQVVPVAAQVVADGQTATSVTGGATLNVTTNSISGGYGVNSFAQFNVAAGQTVNIHAPGGTAGTVNIINGSQSQIMGTVNGMLDGSVGGELYLANPNGFIVGSGGIIRAGGVHISTPSAAMLDAPDAAQQIVAGSAALGGGNVRIDGAIAGKSLVTFNIGGNLAVNGKVSADARADILGIGKAGTIEMRAKGDIVVAGSVSAEGKNGADGGKITIFADRNATLDATGTASVSAKGSGDGGELEFSARDVVLLRGRLNAGSESGALGTILIDPVDAVIDTNDLSGGGNIHIEASARIVVNDGITLSSRDVATGDNQLTGASVGDSGNISLRAPIIEIGDGARILAHATDGFAAGAVSIIAEWPTDQSPIGLTSIVADGVTITGGDVTIRAKTISHFAINYGTDPEFPDVATYADAIDIAHVPDFVTDALVDIVAGPVNAAAETAETILDAYFASPVIPGLSLADARVSLTDTTVDASGVVTIESKAVAESDFRGTNNSLKAAVAATVASAVTTIENSSISTSFVGFDGLNIGSDAVTDVHVRAQTAAISFSSTTSIVAIRGSEIASPYTATAINAYSTEKQDIIARQAEAGEAIATIFSLRNQKTEVLIDAEAGYTQQNSTVSGNNISISSQADRELVFDANADGTGDDTVTAGAVISVGSGRTHTIIGGDLSVEKLTVYGGALSLGSYADFNPYFVDVTVRGGTFADTDTTPFPGGLWADDWLDAVKALGTEIAAEGVDTTAPGTTITSETSYSLGLAADFINDKVETIVGGSWDGLDLGDVTLTATDRIFASAEWRLENMLKRTDVQSDSGNGGVAALNFGDWKGTADLRIGGGGLVANEIELRSQVTLPTISPFSTEAFTSAGDGLAGILPYVAPSAGPLEADDLMPDLSGHVHAEDYTFTNILGAGANGTSAALDIGFHDFDLAARTIVDDGTAVDVGTSLKLSAVATGSLLSRSVDPDAADIGGSGTGAGGAIQVLKVSPYIEARLGRIGGTAPGGPALGQVEVGATNGLLLATFGGARSNVDNIAIAGALSIIDYGATTAATVSGEGSFQALTTFVHAADQSVLSAMAGGGAVGADGFGAAAGTVFADRTIVAALTDFAADRTATGRVLTASTADIAITYLTVQATDESTTIAVAAAGGGTPGNPLGASPLPDIAMGTRTDEYEDELGELPTDDAVEGDGAGLSTGFAVAADFAGAFITSRVVAAIETGAELASDLTTVGSTDLSDVLLSGGGTLAGSGNSGLGGTLVLADVASDRIALDRGGTRSDRLEDGWASTQVTASDLSDLRLIGASRAGDHHQDAGLATALFVTTERSTSATIEDTNFDSPAQLTVSSLAGGQIIAIGGALAPDVADAAAAAEYDDGDPANDPPTEPSTDVAQPSGVSVGFTYIDVTTRDSVKAGLSDVGFAAFSTADPDVNTSSDVDVSAENKSNIVTFATSLGAGGRWALAGTAGVVHASHTTDAFWRGTNGAAYLTGAVAISAQDSSDLHAAIGAEADAASLSFGASALILTDERHTSAKIIDATIAPNIDEPASLFESIRYTVEAQNGGLLLAFQRAGGGDEGTYGLAVMAGDVEASWSSVARVSQSSLSGWMATVSALEHGQIYNRQEGMASAQNGAGAAGGTVTSHHSDVLAEIDSATVALTSAMTVSATGESIVTQRAVQSGEGKVGAGAVYSRYLGDGTIAATIENSDVAVSQLSLTAIDRTWREIVANAAVTPGAFGVAGGLTVDTYRRNTNALIEGGAIDVWRLTVAASSHTRTNNIALGRAKGTEEIGVAAQLVWIVDDRDVSATVRDAEIAVEGDASITAERTDAYLLLEATVTTSNASVGIGAGVLRLGGTTAAELIAPTALDVLGDLDIGAADRTVAVSIGFGAATDGQFGGVGSMTLLSLGRRPAGATTLSENERGADQRDLSEDIRGDLAELLADEAHAPGDIETTRDSRIIALLTLEAGIGQVHGDIAIEAVDSRAAVALAGEVRSGGLTGPLAYLDKYVRIDSLTTDGIDFGYRNVDISAERGDFGIEVDFDKPWNPDAPGDVDEGGGEEFPIGEEPLPTDEEPLPDGGTDTGADMPGSDGVEEYLGGTEDALGEGMASKGLSVGGALTRITLGGLVDAGIELANNAELQADGSIEISALSTPETIAIAAGSQVGQASFGASAALVRQTQLVRSRIDGDGTASANAVSLSTESNGAAWSIAALLAQADGIAIGATLSVNDLDASAETRIVDAVVESNRAITGVATEKSSGVALAFSGSSPGGSGFAMSTGANSSRSIATAYALGAQLTALAGDIDLRAVRDQSGTGFVMALRIGESINVGAALAISDFKGTAAAFAEDSQLAADDDVKIRADSDSAIGSAAVGVAGASSVGVSGSLSYVNKSDTTRAEVIDSIVNAGDSVLVQAQSGGGMTGLGGGDDGLFGEMAAGSLNVSYGGSAGIGVSLYVVNETSVVEALISGSSTVAADGLSVDDGVQAIGRDADNERTTVTAHGVAVVADNDSTVRGLALTAAFAGSAAVSVQVPILLIEDHVTAGIDGGQDTAVVTAASDVAVDAANDTSITMFTLVAAGASSVGIGADVEYLHLGKTTEAVVSDAQIDAGRDIDIAALASDTISTTSIAGAFGTSVGIAGVVQVALNESDTSALVRGSELVAGDDVTIAANAPRSITQATVGLAGGYVGVSGTVLIYTARDVVSAAVAGAATAGSPLVTTIDANDDVAIIAESELQNTPNVVGGAGGFVGVSAAVLVTHLEQTVSARLGNHATLLQGRANSLSVRASQAFDQQLLLGSGAGGIVGAGASIGYMSQSNSVLAVIGDYANVDVSDSVTVTAVGDRSLSGSAVAASGGYVGVNTAVLVVRMGSPSDHDASTDAEYEDLQSSEETLGDLSADLEGSGAYSHEGTSFSNGDAEVESTISRALEGRRRIDLMEVTSGAADTIKAEIGDNADIIAGGDIAVTAREIGTIDVRAGGAAGGIGAATGGVLVINHGSTVQVAIGDDAEIISEGGDVFIGASADIAFDDATAFAASGGLVSLNGSSANVESARSMSVLVGAGSTIETALGQEIDIEVTETGGLLARGLAFPFGAVAIGGTNATARATSALDIEFAMGGPDRTVLRNGDIDIEIVREGSIIVEAISASGGILSGSGASAYAHDASVSTIDLGDAIIRNRDDDTLISILSDADIEASATGVVVAGAAIGVSIVRADSSTYSEVVADGATIKTGDLRVLVADSDGEFDRRSITADALSSGGGVISGLGGSAHITNVSTSRIDMTLTSLELDGSGAPQGNAAFHSINMSDLYAESTGVGIGVVAAGANDTEIVSNTTAYTRIVFDGVAQVDGSFEAEATGNDLLQSLVRSGTGGLVVVNAASGKLLARPTTNLVLAGDGVVADTIALSTVRDVNLDNVTDSTRVSIVGIGGSVGRNDVEAEMRIDILADMTAKDISIVASGSIDKQVEDYNGTVGEGGLFTGSSLVSDTDVANAIAITVTDATLTQTSTDADDGIDIAILSALDIEDKLKIDTGGGLLLPSARSQVDVNSNDLDVTFTNSQVAATGNIAVGVTTDAVIENAAYVNVYGLAGAPGANAFSSFASTQDVELANGTTLLSSAGTVSLGAGSKWGGAQRILLSTEARAWNGTGLPLPAPPDASASISQFNMVTISPTSRVTAAGDVTLTALGGEYDAYAYATSASLVGEAVEAGLNAFADLLNLDEISLDTERGTSLAVDVNQVFADGRVEAGAFAIKRYHIGPDGSVTLDEGDLDIERLEDVDMSENLEAYIEELEAALDSAGNNAELRTRLEFELARVEAILVGTGGRSDLIVIDNVVAGGGNIIVDTEALSGEGDLIAHGDVLVELLNQSEASVEVRDISISQKPGGQLLYNSISVASNRDIAEITANLAAAEGAFDIPPVPVPAAFGLALDGADGAQPLINIRNDFLQTGDGPKGDLIVTGSVNNPLGTVQLATADGDVMVLGGEIYAKTVSISSGGDFFLSAGLNELVTHLPDDPLALYGDYFDRYLDWVDLGRQGTEPAFQFLTGEGSITAIGGVYVYADYLNINGLIKSGVTDWTLDIAASLDNRLDTVDDWGTEPVLIHTGAGNGAALGTIGSGADAISIADLIGDRITGNVTVRWDPVTHELLLDPISTQGGYIELVGKIISTGGGRVEAASGYGHLDVTSLTDLPLVFNGVDLGPKEGVSGEIRIIDLASPGDGAGSFNITRYVKDPDENILIYRSETNPPVGESPGLPIISMGEPSYEIADNFAVTLNVGTFKLYNTTRVEERWDSQFSSTIHTVSEDTVESDDIPLRFDTVDTYGAPQLLNNPYKYSSYYELDLAAIVEPDWQLDRFDTIGGVDYMIFSRTVTELTTETDYDSHRLAANHAIEIGFDGFGAGKAEITAEGTIYFEGDFRNEGGETTITSTGGSVLTVGDASLQTALTVIEADEGSVGRSGTRFLLTDPDAPLRSVHFGVSSAPMLVDLVEGRGLEISARDNIRIEETSGDMLIRSITSSEDGVIDLTSSGAILVHANAATTGAIIRGGETTLTAHNGRIGSADDPLRVGVDLLTASATGNINIASPQRGLLLDTVVSVLGDVSISSSSFIRDGNSDAALDRLETAGLLDDLWDEMGLRATSLEKVGTAFAAIKDRTEAEYQRYWQTRGLIALEIGGNTVLIGAPYDASYQFSFTPAEKLALVAQGLTLGEIGTLEASRNAEYAALHDRFGSTPYNPNFSYTPTGTELLQATRQMFWTEAQLQNRVRQSILLNAADTDFVIETANVSGVNVTLDAAGSIGEQTGTLSIFAGHTLTPEEVLAIDNAEPSDIIVTDVAAFIDVYEDIDVTATGTVTALADDNLLISSEGQLTIDRIRAGGNARVKSATSLVTDGAIGNGPDVVALNAVLEAGSGTIGTLLDPVTLGDIGRLTARATGDVILVGTSGDVGIGSVLSLDGDVAINASTGSLTDANGSDAADIFAANVLLLARDDIGEADNALDIGPSDTLSVVAAHGEVYLGIPEGDAVISAVGALEGDTEITVGNGNLVLDGFGNNPAIATAGTLTLNVRGSIGSPASLIPQIEAGGAIFNVSGDIGSSTEYMRTTIAGPTSAGATFAVSDLNLLRSDVFIANTGHLAVTGVDLNTNGTLQLINIGDLHIADNAKFTARTISVETAGDGDDLIIDRNMTLVAGELTLAADGDLVLGPGNIDFGGVTRLSGNRIVSSSLAGPELNLIHMVNDDDLTMEGIHGIDTDRIVSDGVVTLRATAVVGGIALVNTRAGHLIAETYLGDVHLQDVTAAELDITAYGAVDGRYAISSRAAIYASSGIGIIGDDVDSLVPLELEAGSGATEVSLRGELGVNVRLIGLGTQVLIDVQTAMVGDGVYRDGGGNAIISLADADPPLPEEDLRGIGVMITSNLANLLLGGTGIDANGSSVILDIGGTLAQVTGAHVTGRDLTLRADRLSNAGPAGFVTAVSELSLDVALGDAHLRNQADLRVSAANAGGDLDIYAVGDLALDGAVSAGGIASLTGLSVGGSITSLEADTAYFNALLGTVGTDDTPLTIAATGAATYNFHGRDGIYVAASGDVSAGYLLSANGDIELATNGDVDIDVVGTPGAVVFSGNRVAVATYGGNAAVDTLPPLSAPILPGTYPEVTAQTPQSITVDGDSGVPAAVRDAIMRRLGANPAAMAGSVRAVLAIRALLQSGGARVSFDLGGPGQNDDDEDETGG